MQALRATLLGLLLQVPSTTAEVRGPTPPAFAYPFQGTLRPTAHVDRSLSGRVTIRTDQKELAIRWGFNVPDANEPAEHERVWASQRLALPFWPTAATAIGDALLVAGVGEDGRTIVERWAFEHTDLPGRTARPSYEPAISKRTVLDADDEGRRTVRFLFTNRGATERVFVQFADSHDLYGMNATTGEMERVYTTSTVSALSDPAWEYVWGARHATQGLMYIYQADLHGPPVAPLVLVDADADGTLDEWVRPSDEEWLARFGRASPQTLIELFD